MTDQTSISLSYLFCEPAPILFDNPELYLGNAEPVARLARAFLSVYPAHRSDQNRLIFSSRPRMASNLTPGLSFPLPKGPDKRSLTWWSGVSLALLPGVPIQITVSDGHDVDRPQAFVQLELVGGQILIGETHRTRFTAESLGLAENADELPYLSYMDLAYSREQAEWLLQLGACLVHQGEPGDAFQLVRFLEANRHYEYRFGFQANSALAIYAHEFEDLQDIEWHRALNLDRSYLGLLEPGLVTSHTKR